MIYVNEKQIKKDYKSGLTYKEIQEKYKITRNQLIVFIRKHKLKRKSNRSYKNNKNALGNKGGHAPKQNKNAVVTGAYETIFNTVLDEEEKVLFTRELPDEKKLLEEEIQMHDVRILRMMRSIDELKLKKKQTEMSITKIVKRTGENSGTVTEVENIIAQIQRIEVALTGVKEARRRCIDTMIRLKLIPKPEGEQGNGKANPILESIVKQLKGGAL